MATTTAVKAVEFDWEDFEKLGRLLEAQKYQFARTMAYNPHWYTLRKKWLDPEHEWIWTVERIRAWGYKQKYGKSWYTCIDINEHFYWTMGLPIGSIAVEGWDWLNIHGTTLINRKVGTGNAALTLYDSIAEAYDYLLMASPVVVHDKVFDAIGNIRGLTVLDIGCGTGMTLCYADHAGYVGLDPSRKMVTIFKTRWASAVVVCTTLGAYVPIVPARFDVVLGLFGVGSYLTDHELGRVPLLLSPGGRAFLMFYDESLPPVLHDGPRRAYSPALAVAGWSEILRVNGFVLCKYEKP